MSNEVVAVLPEVARDGFHALRHAARDSFMEQGWPNRRVEAYKYTSLVRFKEKTWQRPQAPGEVGELPQALGNRMLWVDGYTDGASPDAHLQLLRDCAAAPSSGLSTLLGQLAPWDDPVVALNTALFDHGAWLDLPAGAAPETPLEIVHAFGRHASPSETHARLAIHLGENARLTLVERFSGDCDDALLSRVAEIALDVGAELLHIRLNEAGDGSQILGHSSVRVGAGAHYRCLTLDLGGKLAREAFHVDLDGQSARTDLTGLALTDRQRHADSDVLIRHNATHTVSKQHFRGILDGRSRSVYSGKVLVAQGAQKSDSSQNSANLLLSRGAEADTRPQLEIYADDVSCDHGAATGAIDPDALFYLESRGIPADAARRMI
ncbi:MAG: Fe-S cluster assembly protein SufD, partial [Sinobacteraceae bacterium]|nr:Fe-S cluster assembly protein SufD [Nevskiaceae bacterium]